MADTAHTLHRCRFPSFAPSPITALALTPASFHTSLLGFGGHSGERSLLAVGRANGDVELMLWGGKQGWISWQTIPSSFPMPSTSSSKKPLSLLSHLTFTHQTTLSASDVELYSGDLEGAQKEVERLKREGVRLFGIGGVGSELVEWEWGGPGAGKEVGRVKSTLPTLPPIFALAATSSGSHLAIACEDSTIRLLSILDGELELTTRLELGGPGKIRGVSLAWGPCDLLTRASDEEDDEIAKSNTLPFSFSTPLSTSLLVGCSNSSLRLFRRPTLASPFVPAHRLTVDRVPGEHTVVWACSFLGNGKQMVSGDSTGNVKVWDAEMGTQLASFRAHRADVLSLAVNPEGTQIFSSGIDQKTNEFRLVTTPVPRWILSSGRRMHAHDVRSLVLDSHPVPVLTSGGLDMGLVVVHAATERLKGKGKERSRGNEIGEGKEVEFESTVQRKASYVPQRENARGVHLATTADGVKRVVVRGSRSVSMWSVGGQREGWKKDVDMELKLQTNLIASDVSPNGKYLAVSDLYETKLFVLTTASGKISPRRQKTLSTLLSDALPPSLGTGSSALRFTKDSQYLLLATAFGGTIAVVYLGNEDEEEDTLAVDVIERRARPKRNGVKVKKSNGRIHDAEEESDDEDEAMDGIEEQNYRAREDSHERVSSIEVSDDGRWMAVANLSRKVTVWSLEELSCIATLPVMASVPSAMTFAPRGQTAESTLVLSFPDNSLAAFAIASRKLYSRTTSLLDLPEPALGIEFDYSTTGTTSETNESPMVVWGANWVARVSLSDLQAAPTSTAPVKRRRHSDAREKREKEDRLEVRVIRKFSPILLFGFASDGEIVVVEKVWNDVARQKGMPDAWVRSGEFAT